MKLQCADGVWRTPEASPLEGIRPNAVHDQRQAAGGSDNPNTRSRDIGASLPWALTPLLT